MSKELVAKYKTVTAYQPTWGKLKKYPKTSNDTSIFQELMDALVYCNFEDVELLRTAKTYTHIGNTQDIDLLKNSNTEKLKFFSLFLFNKISTHALALSYTLQHFKQDKYSVVEKGELAGMCLNACINKETSSSSFLLYQLDTLVAFIAENKEAVDQDLLLTSLCVYKYFEYQARNEVAESKINDLITNLSKPLSEITNHLYGDKAEATVQNARLLGVAGDICFWKSAIASDVETEPLLDLEF